MIPPNQVPTASEIEGALQESSTKEDQDFAGVFGKRHASDPERGWNLLHGTFGFLLRTLGPALVYELQSLLAARLGANFRNLIAHGLLSAEALRSETAFYLWWLFLRLIALPTPKMTAFVERRSK